MSASVLGGAEPPHDRSTCPVCVENASRDTAPDRAEKLRVIRADRLARGGEPAPSIDAVLRDVVASSDLAGIDARPHLEATGLGQFFDEAIVHRDIKPANALDLAAEMALLLGEAQAAHSAVMVLERRLQALCDHAAALVARQRASVEGDAKGA